MYTYRATCLRVIDGDTVELHIDLGFRMYYTARCRLYNVDAPELFSGTDRDQGELAKQHLEQLISNKNLIITTYKDRTTFGRWVVQIKTEDDGIDINTEIEAFCKSLIAHTHDIVNHTNI